MSNIKDLIQKDFHSLLIVGNIDIETLPDLLDVHRADFQVLAAETIKIEQVRQLLHWLNLSPMSQGKKLAVISGAEQMTTEAANALLKTLEEPPSYAQIILLTQNEQKILATIQSRCRKVRIPILLDKNLPENYLSPVQLAQMSIKERFDWAAKIAEQESDIIKKIITCWQADYRDQLLKGEDKLEILTELSRAKDLLETNISVKLLLENLILNF